MTDSPALQSFLRAVAPSKFSAKTNEDVHDWLIKVNRYFDILKLTLKDHVLTATMLLDGLAAKWALNLPPPSPTSRSVTKYNFQFDTIRATLDDLSEAEAIHYYFMGLKPKIHEHFAGNPTLRADLSIMMNIAESLDNEQFHNNIQSHPYGNKSHPHQESFPQPMDLDVMSTTGEDQKQKQMHSTPELITPKMELLSNGLISSAVSKLVVPSVTPIMSSPGGASTSKYLSKPLLSADTLSMFAMLSEFPNLPEEPEDKKLMYIVGQIKNHKLDILVNYGAIANYI
ncbi:hypothetical protein FBU30_002619, partial [Linnemannia zychae]